jgi:hypothetical protein
MMMTVRGAVAARLARRAVRAGADPDLIRAIVADVIEGDIAALVYLATLAGEW